MKLFVNIMQKGSQTTPPVADLFDTVSDRRTVRTALIIAAAPKAASTLRSYLPHFRKASLRLVMAVATRSHWQHWSRGKPFLILVQARDWIVSSLQRRSVKMARSSAWI